MQGRAQAIYIGTRRGLRATILFGCSVARRAKSGSIFLLSWLKVARDTKIDQINVLARGQHDVRGLEIAENDRWLTCMQIVQHGTELQADFQHFVNWQSFLAKI